MNEESEMSTMPDDVNDKINSGRQTLSMSRDEPDEMEPRRVPPAVIAAGVGAAIVGLGLLGWLLYRSRRRRTLMQQLQASLPDRVRDLHELQASLPDRVRELRGVGDDLLERLRKAV